MNMSKQILAFAATAIIMRQVEGAAMNEACNNPAYQCKLYTGSDDSGDYWNYCLRTNWFGDRLPHQGYSFIKDLRDLASPNNQFKNAQIGYVSCGENVAVELCKGTTISNYNNKTQFDDVKCKVKIS